MGEASDFSANEKELMEALSAVSRAVGILEKEMAKNPASFAQLPTADLEGTLHALSTGLDAAALSSSDKSTLVALAQTQQNDEDDEPGAPVAATYKTHSTNILDVLEDMKEKAEGQLSDLRKAEVNSRQNYEMLKQSLEDQAGADTKGMGTEKAYCDEQIAKTEFKKGELEDDISKMTSRIDKAAARSVQLKAEVKQLQSELGALAKGQAEMDKIRMETHDDYRVAKADLELGLSGVGKALSLLREYYGNSAALLQSDAQQPTAPEKHEQSGGAGGGIINILEVCQADFAKNLAKEESEEADAQSEYEKVSQENAIVKATKEQDVKYKTQEAKSADSTVAEYSSDREATNSEYSAVMEYCGKIKERCIAKPETYEARKGRREAEIAGLKQALTILKEETALVQRKKRSHFLGSVAA